MIKTKNEYLYVLQYVGLLLIIVAIVLGFAIFGQFRHKQFPKPREINSNSIQAWMTIDYISRTYHIPPNEIHQKLEYKFTSDKESIGKIAKDNKVDPGIVIEKIQTIITSR